jgi:hypothetical protein
MLLLPWVILYVCMAGFTLALREVNLHTFCTRG